MRQQAVYRIVGRAIHEGETRNGWRNRRARTFEQVVVAENLNRAVDKVTERQKEIPITIDFLSGEFIDYHNNDYASLEITDVVVTRADYITGVDII